MNDKLYQKFFSDPDWSEVENMLMKYVEPLKDPTTIDTTQPAEHVKAELIGRMIAYNKIVDFLNDTKIVQRRLERNPNPFR